MKYCAFHSKLILVVRRFFLFYVTKITSLIMPCLQPLALSFTEVTLSLVCAIFLTAVSNVMQKSETLSSTLMQHFKLYCMCLCL